MRFKSVTKLWLSMVVLGGVFLNPVNAAQLGAKAITSLSREEQLQKLQDYLNGIHTIRARFSQKNPNGSYSAGKMSLQRLGKENSGQSKFGKMRLEYTPPTKMSITANNDKLCHEDGDEVSGYEVDSTPASFLLRRKIDFSDDLEVKDLTVKDGKIFLALSRSGDDGVILTLVFVTSPFLRLQEWTVIDGQENKTHVTLKDVEIGVQLDKQLFTFSKRCQAMISSGNQE